MDAIDIGTSTIEAKAYAPDFSGGEVIGREILDNIPLGNGDISSALKVLPNVSSNNASSTSQMPGEIDPANISISGGLPYQNSFLLDGFEVNNDLDPAGSNSNTQPRQRSGRSQGLNIDASLLDSIIVLDSNVSAAYGRFSGGVVEANVKKPRSDGFHGGLSYQLVRDKFTKYYTYDNSALGASANSTNENYQPNFHKHLVRANLQGNITQNLAFVASYATIRSYIPLSNTFRESKEQKRVSDNYYMKLFYNPLESLNIEYNLSFMPQDNSYFTPNMRNSGYTMRQGGIQSGLKISWQNDFGLWTNQISYSHLENSRRSDANYYTRINGGEGQYGSVNQIQHNASFKSDFLFNPLDFGRFEHNFRAGLEAIYQKAIRDRIEDSHMYIYAGNPVNLNGNSWNGLSDSFGFISANATQYYNTMGIIKAGKTQFGTATYGAYIEDEIRIDLGEVGEIKTRFGLRLDGDNYMKKHELAPRFSMSYISSAPREYQTQITFGANRYYARNLLAYRFYSDAINNRWAYYRCDPNDAWIHFTGGATTNLCSGSPTINSNLSNGIVKTGNRLSDLEVPYDDEFMGAVSQNLGIFNLSLKYIHRDGKKQVTQNLVRQNNATSYLWGNNGTSKSDIIALIFQNTAPIVTSGIHHHYLFALDWNNTKRSYNTHSADYDLDDYIIYNGQKIQYETMPPQKYNQPLTLKLATAHSYNIGRVKLSLNNFFTYKGQYQRIVLDSIPNNESCNASNNTCKVFNDKKLGNDFNWDLRFGVEYEIFKLAQIAHIVYVNLDIYNLLGSKHLVTLSGEDGVLLYGVPSNAAVLGYGIGRQFWIQVGVKF